VVTDEGLELLEDELSSLDVEVESSFALVVVEEVVVVVVVAWFEPAEATVVVLLPSAGSWPSTTCT
jgi:hypothetical protein